VSDPTDETPEPTYDVHVYFKPECSEYIHSCDTAEEARAFIDKTEADPDYSVWGVSLAIALDPKTLTPAKCHACHRVRCAPDCPTVADKQARKAAQR
jgi:Fe-S-cluster-containing hydrogenase component 2